MKYRVFMEFDVISTDIAEITIEAQSLDEAKTLAIKAYHDGESLDYYSTNNFDSELDTQSDWRIDEILI